MTAQEQQHYETLLAIGQEYARLRAVFVQAHEDALLQAMNIARFIEAVDRDTVSLFEQLRALENGEVPDRPDRSDRPERPDTRFH